jgi:hypothetical protein
MSVPPTTEPHREAARRYPSHRSLPATTRWQRLIQIAFELLRNLGVAVTAAVTALAVVLLVHAVTVNETVSAASTAHPREVAEPSRNWVERVAARCCRVSSRCRLEVSTVTPWALASSSTLVG